MQFTFEPLPKSVHLMPSSIHGYGIFAKDYIPEDTLIGISHVKDGSKLFHNGIIRTPLGGFLNHSLHPSCVLICDQREWYLWTIHEIYPNHELTIDYNLYECGIG